MTAPATPAPVHIEEDRSATIAVLIFPLIILVGAVIASITPHTFTPLKPYLLPLLAFIMFCMGLTITLPDLNTVLRRPWPIFLGVACQYIIMPLSALAIAHFLGLNQAATVGLLMLGSVPGGTSSNVVAYLAKGDVALSVAMTSVSTLISPLVTPLLMLWLAGTHADVDATGMALNLVKTVLFPVALGLLIRVVAHTIVEKLLPILPWLSIVTVGAVLVTVVALNSKKFATVGLVVLIAVAIQNGVGYLFGYYTSKVAKQPVKSCRTTAIEVAMQNSALAAALSSKFFTPEAAIPGTIAAIWSNCSGAVYAAIVRTIDMRAAKKAAAVSDRLSGK